MADETENTEIEETADEAQVADVVEETTPEIEEPAAEADPVAEVEEDPEPEAAEPAPAEEEPAVEPEPMAAEVADELVADTEEAPPADGAAEEAEEAPAEVAAAVSGPKVKKKRLPRSARTTKTRPKRVPATERKSITRLPKPEHERGRRQERQGTVVSAASDKTIVVRVDTVKVHPRYKKVIKRSTRLHAHDEENQAKLGDVVRIIETRPLSRMKRWRLQEIVEAAK